MRLGKVLSFCSVALIFIFIVTFSHPVSSAGSGEDFFTDCLHPKTRLLNCNDTLLVRRFYFDSRQNRCRGFLTCPIRNATPNLFLTRAECTSRCPAVPCALPDPPRNGNQSVEHRNDGRVHLNYTCQPGFTLLGDPRRTCQYSGAWNGIAPSCEIRCPRAPAIENGLKLLETSREKVVRMGTLVLYGCNPGYRNILKMSMFQYCTPDGTWNAEPPFCGKLVILHNNKEVQKISANNGEGLQVDCVMKPRFPPNSNCTWFYPTEDQVNSSTTWTADRSAYSLQIPKLRVKDSGDYNCKVNVSRRVISKDIEIEVQELKAPTIVTQPQRVLFSPYLDVICVVYGTPKPEVTWFYNNVSLPATRVNRINNNCNDRGNPRIMVTDENPDSQKHTLSVLKICNPTPQDSGLYFCQGTNQVGTINSESTFINTTLPPASRGRRSLSAASSSHSHPPIDIGALCSAASDPSTGTYVGKVRRHFPSSNSYYLTVDRALDHRSDQLATKKLIRARSSPLPITRQGRYFFAVRTTGRGKRHIVAVYPHSSVLERVVQICMRQEN